MLFLAVSACTDTTSPATLHGHKGWFHPILQIFLVQNSYRGKEWNQFCPPSSSDDLCLLFCLYPSSMLSAQWTKHFPRAPLLSAQWTPHLPRAPWLSAAVEQGSQSSKESCSSSPQSSKTLLSLSLCPPATKVVIIGLAGQVRYDDRIIQAGQLGAFL